MAKRYIGDAVVTIVYHDSGDYRGTVRAGDHSWHFEDLHAPRMGFSFAYDSPEAYDEMARSAVSFGSYYTTHNRGDDTPEWAPPPEVADAIDEAVGWAQDDQGTYEVRRSPSGKAREMEDTREARRGRRPSDQKAEWMRTFQDDAVAFGAHPGQIRWQDAESLYHQGWEAKAAARKLYGPSLSEARRRPSPTVWTRQNTKINTWFERDRASVVLETLDGTTIIEWWDEAVEEAVQDGFLDPRDYHGSAIEYANYVGAQPATAGTREARRRPSPARHERAFRRHEPTGPHPGPVRRPPVGRRDGPPLLPPAPSGDSTRSAHKPPARRRAR